VTFLISISESGRIVPSSNLKKKKKRLSSNWYKPQTINNPELWKACNQLDSRLTWQFVLSGDKLMRFR
jgi:hypothetical protein